MWRKRQSWKAVRLRLAARRPLLVVLLLLIVGHTEAVDAAPPSRGDASLETGVPEPAPKQIRNLLDALNEPEIRQWLEHQERSSRAGSESTMQTGFQDLFQHYMDAVRGHLLFIVRNVPELPKELAAAARRVSDASSETGAVRVLARVVAVVGSGLGAEALFRRATRGRRKRIIDARFDTVGERVGIVPVRLFYALLTPLIFAAGSLGGFLLVDWPPLIGALVLDGLLAVILVRFALTLGWFVLSPDTERFRLVPMSDPAARFWYRSFAALAATASFGWATSVLAARLGFSEPARMLATHIVGLALVAMAIWIVWSGRRSAMTPARTAVTETGATSHAVALLPVLATILLPLIALLLMAGANGAAWFLIVAASLPAAITIARRAVMNLLRPVDPAPSATALSPAYAAVVERGVRAILIIIAALVLARAWELDMAAFAARETFAMRVLRGSLDGVIVFLTADLVWQLIKIAIDRKLNSTGDLAAAEALSEEEIRKRARVRTLLPIVRNILLAALISVAVLTALSAMGIQIGPLLAGAGVVGVAVGFGAQTLVKDIIAGIFLLLDDAFRVGEYIVSGNIRGTVESFSLRSVRLRHHRGQLHTVAFGDLKEITNYSRDWVIDKIQIGVSYDTDLDAVKHVVKQVSAEIMEDPELAAVIIEPLKSQGVYRMDDFAIHIRLKITTKPNEQFLVRRAIYHKIKKAFDASGIKFANPTVTVAVADSDKAVAAAAAAHQALKPTQSPPAAALYGNRLR